MEAGLAQAGSAEEIIAALRHGLEEFVEHEADSQAVIYELLSASRHSEEIRSEMAELYRRWRAHLADALREKEREGVVSLQAQPEAVAAVLFALGDGLGIQMVSDPAWDSGPGFELGVRTARSLLGAPV
jgi:DNA-binding transcriptional MocR family regulator